MLGCALASSNRLCTGLRYQGNNANNCFSPVQTKFYWQMCTVVVGLSWSGWTCMYMSKNNSNNEITCITNNNE